MVTIFNYGTLAEADFGVDRLTGWAAIWQKWAILWLILLFLNFVNGEICILGCYLVNFARKKILLKFGHFQHTNN